MQYEINPSAETLYNTILLLIMLTTSWNLFILANCPAGSYFSAHNDTCLKCPFGTYQPMQGQKDCVSCGKDLITVLNGTLEEAGCIGNTALLSD